MENVVHLFLPQRPQMNVHDLHTLPARKPLLQVLLRLVLERLGLFLSIVPLGVNIRRLNYNLVGRHLVEKVLDETFDRARGGHFFDRAIFVDAASSYNLEKLVEIDDVGVILKGVSTKAAPHYCVTTCAVNMSKQQKSKK